MSAVRKAHADVEKMNIEEILRVYEINGIQIPRRGKVSNKLYKAILENRLAGYSIKGSRMTPEQRKGITTNRSERNREATREYVEQFN